MTARVVRGGSWNDNPQNCRSSNRNRNEPDNRNNNIGFRVVVHFCGKLCRSGITRFTDLVSVAEKVLAPLLSRLAHLPGGRIYGVGPGGSGIPRGERPARLLFSTRWQLAIGRWRYERKGNSMGLGDLFKSKQERERDEAKKRRKAFRDAENAVDVVKDRIAKLKKDRDKSWAEARQYLKDGQKASAQRCVQAVRASEMLMSKLEMKRWVFEQLLSKLELAKSDQDFAQALNAINTVVQIDPDAVADVLDEVQDKLGEQVDTDKIWEKMYGKEMEGVETQMTDTVPPIEDMLKQLEDEVAEDIGAGRSSKKTQKESEISDQIGEARSRLKKLMEDEK